MSQKPRRPTLQDVADLVGITKMTVSRYLKDPALVSAAVQEKIAVALDTLGYIPNRAPDLLSNAKSKAIGVLLPSLTNQVFAEVIGHPLASVEYRLFHFHRGPAPFLESAREDQGDRAAILFAQLERRFAVKLPFAELLEDAGDKWLRNDLSPAQADDPLADEDHEDERADRDGIHQRAAIVKRLQEILRQKVHR